MAVALTVKIKNNNVKIIWRHKMAQEFTTNKQVLKFVEESVALLADNKKPKDYFSKCFLNFVSYEYTILMYLSAQLNKKDFESLKNKLKGYKWTLKYGKGKKTKIIRLLTYIMPIKWVCKIIKFVKK
jgi:hypothetical protein